MAHSDEVSRVRLQEIADRVGVSRMTVSRAIRGISYVRKELKARILQEAERAGYECTPIISDIMGALRRSRKPTYHETIAFVHDSSPYYKLILSGVKAMASKLGYGVDCIVPDSTPFQRDSQLTRVLRARGIRGVLLAPLSDTPHPHVTLRWQYFSTVLVGSSLANRGLVRVQFDHFAACKLLIRKLLHLGYRRIALILTKGYHERSNRLIQAAFQAWHPLPRDAQELTLLYNEGGKSELKKWIRSCRPECFIGGADWPEYLWEIAGCKIPEQFGFASLVTGDRPTLSGTQTNQDLIQIGAEAMRALDGQLRGGMFGLQQFPITVNIPPGWQAGRTAVRQQKPRVLPRGTKVKCN